MNFLNKFRIIIIVCFFIITPFTNIFCEKWAGQAASYQLIDGSKTASGEFFDKDSLSAACNGFKLGAEVVIINPKNYKKIKVIINDRISPDSTFFILITPKAAKDLGFEWETGLVVVEGNFSDVNSTERLVINGLAREGEVDPETLKKFPDINWPKDDKIVADQLPTEHKDNGFPVKEEKETPEKDTKTAKLDTDEKNGKTEKVLEEIEEKEILEPKKEETLKPEEKTNKYAMNEDEKNGVEKAVKEEKVEKEPVVEKEILEPKKEDKIALVLPDLKKEENKIDIDTKDKEAKIEEKVIEKVEEKVIEKKEESPIVWEKDLIKNKIYLRFSTTPDKKEGERRYRLFKKVFVDIIGIEKEGKYILYIGPITEDQIDALLKKIRNYGFKDSYITKG